MVTRLIASNFRVGLWSDYILFVSYLAAGVALAIFKYDVTSSADKVQIIDVARLALTSSCQGDGVGGINTARSPARVSFTLEQSDSQRPPFDINKASCCAS